MARTHYLGRLKQRMVRAHTDAEAQPGMPIYAPELPGQTTGSVVDAALSPDGGYDLLAVVHLRSAATGVLHLGTETGPILSLLPLALFPCRRKKNRAKRLEHECKHGGPHKIVARHLLFCIRLRLVRLPELVFEWSGVIAIYKQILIKL